MPQKKGQPPKGPDDRCILRQMLAPPSSGEAQAAQQHSSPRFGTFTRAACVDLLACQIPQYLKYHSHPSILYMEAHSSVEHHTSLAGTKSPFAT